MPKVPRSSTRPLWSSRVGRSSSPRTIRIASTDLRPTGWPSDESPHVGADFRTCGLGPRVRLRRRPRARAFGARHEPPLVDPRALGGRVTYFADVGALARKDLLLELRAKETVPAMLLFVLSTLTIFHFALPRGTGHVAALGLLWVALVFTALLGLTRAFVPEREQELMDALVLA